MSGAEEQNATPEERPPTPEQTPAESPPSDTHPPPSAPPEELEVNVDKEVEEALAQMPPDELAMLTAPTPGQPTVGGMCQAKVVSIVGEDVFVDLGGRAEGVVPLVQFDTPPEIGSTVELLVERLDEQSGTVYLSREGAVKRATWDSLRPGAMVEGRVTGMNKGGLEVDLQGIRGFMPASHCDVQRMHDISVLIGQTLRCLVIEVDRRSSNVLLSRRRLVEKERAEARQTLLAELQPGQVRQGTVANVTDFGAFVELGAGVHGLIHISDLSYTRIKHPSEVVQTGQTVEVKVLKVSREKNKISLGLKQVAPDPWRGVEQKYVPDTNVKGRVVRLADFGAFVELEPGVEALVPRSEMTWMRRLRHPSELLSEGQVIEGVILRVEPKRHRISISLKKLEEDPWTGVEQQYPAHAVVTGKVTRTTDFGAFVELHPGVEGLVHISELSAERVRKVTDVVQPGQEVKVQVLNVDPKARKISLSIKAATEQPEKPPSEEEPRPPRKHKRPLRGGLTAEGGWFSG